MACPGRNNPWNTLKMTHNNNFGDWLFLYYVAKNVDNHIFRELLVQLGSNDQKENSPILEKPLIIGFHAE